MNCDDMAGDRRAAARDPRDQAVYERILRHVEYVGGEDDCWVWCGAVVAGGYPVIRLGSRTDGTRRMELVARWMYRFCRTSDAWTEMDCLDALDITHRCGNTRCVQPGHLAATSHQQVMQRAGVTRVARRSRRVDKHKEIA